MNAVISGAPQIEKAPALGFSIMLQAGTAQLTFQTFIDRDADIAAINELVDKVTTVLDRQKAKADLVDMRKHLKVQEAQLVRMREDRGRIETAAAIPQDGRRNPNRAQDAQKLEQQRQQADVNEKRMGEIITEARNEIAAAEAVVAGE